MIRFLRALCLLFFAIVSVPTRAQTHSQSLYWIRYRLQVSLGKGFSYGGEIENRRFFSPDVQNQLIHHSRVRYRAGRWEFAAGPSYSLAYASFPERGYKQAVHEFRPVTEVNLDIPVGKTTLAQRLWVDWRFFQSDPDETVFSSSDFRTRFRYRLQVKFPLSGSGSNASRSELKTANEIMVNDRGNFFDQNRFYLSTDYKLNETFSVELGYVWIYQQRSGTDEFFSRHVVRFTLTQRI